MDERIVEFIIRTDQPFTIVESESFRNLFNLLPHSIHFPTADTIKSRIAGMFKIKKDGIKSKLKVSGTAHDIFNLSIPL